METIDPISFISELLPKAAWDATKWIFIILYPPLLVIGRRIKEAIGARGSQGDPCNHVGNRELLVSTRNLFGLFGFLVIMLAVGCIIFRQPRPWHIAGWSFIVASWLLWMIAFEDATPTRATRAPKSPTRSRPADMLSYVVLTIGMIWWALVFGTFGYALYAHDHLAR